MEREQLEKATREYNMLHEQIQSLAMQRQQFIEQKEEYKEALAALEKATGKIYMAVGGVIVEVEKAKAIESVKEREENSEMRISIVKKQQEDLTKKEQSLRTEISAALKDFKG